MVGGVIYTLSWWTASTDYVSTSLRFRVLLHIYNHDSNTTNDIVAVCIGTSITRACRGSYLAKFVLIRG